MSYDFRLFKQRAGENPQVTARRDAEDFAITTPLPETEALKRRVADALMSRNPKLEVFQLDHNKIADFDEISVEETRVKYRYLQLNGPEIGGNGIQITLFDDEASVTVPFWHEGDKATATFREIWDYLKIIGQETGYLIYDPQIDCVFDPTAGFDDALACYAQTMQQLHRAASTVGPSRRPWWKFW